MTTADSRVGTSFGRYELIALLGQGGMGEVYEARDTEKKRTVALKILRDQYAEDENFRARFLRESHAAAILQEPHVIPIHDWGDFQGNLYIDMRLVNGQTLYDLVKRGPLDPQRGVNLIEQTASALDAAHAAGLIHRDVKPQNIIVTPADFAYLVDFGIVETQGDARLTMDGTQIGSLAYMPPERFGDMPTTPAADIYSLACVLYEALTGDTPFSAQSYEHLITSHLTAPPPRAAAVNAQVPAALDDVIARGMAKDPDDRYGSAGALARAAQRALLLDPRIAAASAETMAAPTPPSAASATSSVGTSPTNATDSEVAGRSARSWVLPVVIAASAALVLGALGIVIGLLMGSDDPDTPADAPQTSAPTLTQVSRPSYTVPPRTTAVPPTVTVTESASPPYTIAMPTPPPITVTGMIVGTCDEGSSCGVKQRTQPVTEAPRLYPTDLRDGTLVTVSCQTVGDLRTSQGAGSSTIWYRLDNGAYVNSVYVSLPPYGIPSC
ncbi:protein kinase domain-containing protein [Mycobacterium sp. ITM-2016-00318]|uniref:protein kinase domain-containing protein n=1 Tax=Mycobacterium sp. ITM-2016-00318 TaxID=2099693 RepID=UPI001E44DA04|nr:protein kinase [Mycobacterium sp. ITM-2016-00318]WNG93681.1 protein kinase [Mycobacterium sp. ITM-2016-00318]